MSKQLEDIIRPYSSLSYDEKLELIRRVRKNKYEVRPALAQRKSKVKKQAKKKQTSTINSLLKGLTEEEIDKLKTLMGI